MTTAHRIEAVLLEDGKLSLNQLPFRAGQEVEVIVLPVTRAPSTLASLRGSVLKYDRPTEPAVEVDWDAAQ